MQIEYQREAYQEVINEEVLQQKFDSYAFSEQLKNQVNASQGSYDKFIANLEFFFEHIDIVITKILDHCPFSKKLIEYKYLKMSLMLNTYYSLKLKGRLELDPASVILWKLPKSLASYLKVLLKEFYAEIKNNIMDCYEDAAPFISDGDLKKMLDVNGDTYENQ